MAYGQVGGWWSGTGAIRMTWPRHSPRVARGEADKQHAPVGFAMRTEVGLTSHARTLQCLHRAGRVARGKPMLGLRQGRLEGGDSGQRSVLKEMWLCHFP